jgi:hypothetical protein
MRVVSANSVTFILSHRAVLRFISLFSIFALFAVVKAETLLDVPEGLTAMTPPDITGTKLRKIESYSREDGLVTVTVVVYPPVSLSQEADGVVAGTIAGMKNKGFMSEKITNGALRGFDCRKIEGLIRSESYEGAFQHSSLLLFSTDAVYVIARNVHESTSFDPSIEDLANRLKIAGRPAILMTAPRQNSVAYEAGQKIGQALFYVILVLVIVLIVWRVNAKKKA